MLTNGKATKLALKLAPRAHAIAALRRAHPSLPLVTFSHFVPRPELSPEKRFLMFPNLAKVRRRTSAQFVAIPRQTPGAIPL